MEIRPSGAPIDDPFFAAVRRRHPDVDIVVLPPTAPEVEPETTVDDATVDRATELVEAFADELWVAIAPLSETEPEARLRYGARESEVRAVARVVDRRSDGYAVLVRLRHELELRGWAVAPAARRPGAADREPRRGPAARVVRRGDRRRACSSWAPRAAGRGRAGPGAGALMEVVPATVGEASRRWDDEHLDLQSAADGIGCRTDRRLHRRRHRYGGPVHLGLAAVRRRHRRRVRGARGGAAHAPSATSSPPTTRSFDDFVALGGFLEEKR